MSGGLAQAPRNTATNAVRKTGLETTKNPGFFSASRFIVLFDAASSRDLPQKQPWLSFESIRQSM